MAIDSFSSTSSSYLASLSSQQMPSPSPTSRPSPAKRKAGRKKFRETRRRFNHGARQRNGGEKTRIEKNSRTRNFTVSSLHGESSPHNFPGSKVTPVEAATETEKIHSPPRISTTTDMEIGEVTLSWTELEVAAMVMETPVVFIDDEAMFNLPELLTDMAAGLLITPPALRAGFE